MKEIKGFEGMYAVTKDGRVFSLPRQISNGKGIVQTVAQQQDRPWKDIDETLEHLFRPARGNEANRFVVRIIGKVATLAGTSVDLAHQVGPAAGKHRRIGDVKFCKTPQAFEKFGP